MRKLHSISGDLHWHNLLEAAPTRKTVPRISPKYASRHMRQDLCDRDSAVCLSFVGVRNGARARELLRIAKCWRLYGAFEAVE